MVTSNFYHHHPVHEHHRVMGKEVRAWMGVSMECSGRGWGRNPMFSVISY